MDCVNNSDYRGSDDRVLGNLAMHGNVVTAPNNSRDVQSKQNIRIGHTQCKYSLQRIDE